MGHYGAALLAAAVVVPNLDRREGVLFTLFVLVAAMLPDVDGAVPWLVHRGMTHTVAFGVGAAVGGGLVATLSFVGFRRLTGGQPREPRAKRVFLLTGTGLFAGVVSHLAIDALTVLPPGLPGARPIRPFRPLFDWPVSVELLPPFRDVSNLLLLVAGGTAWVLAFATARSTRKAGRRSETSD